MRWVLVGLPASLLPPPNSATYQPPWSFVLISHSMSNSWSQSFLFTHLTQCKDENPYNVHRALPDMALATSLTPFFYHCSHYLRPTNIYPSASSPCSIFFLCTFMWLPSFLYPYVLLNGLIFSNDHCNWIRISKSLAILLFFTYYFLAHYMGIRLKNMNRGNSLSPLTSNFLSENMKELN